MTHKGTIVWQKHEAEICDPGGGGHTVKFMVLFECTDSGYAPIHEPGGGPPVEPGCDPAWKIAAIEDLEFQGRTHENRTD